MENLNSLKSAELITLAQAGNESALAEINRRHANRVTKNKKPIPAVAKFLGLAPAKPAKPAKTAKAKPAANDLSDDELVAKYAKSSAAFLKNMLAKVVDPRKKTAMLVALNAKTSAGMVSVATPVQPSVAVSKQLAGIIKALDGLSQGDQAMVLAALSA
jgi:hypothetical protein